MKNILSKTLLCQIIVLLVILGYPQPAAFGITSADGWTTALEAEKAKRGKQGDAVKTSQEQLADLILPFDTEQEKLKKAAEPLSNTLDKTEEKITNFKGRVDTHVGNCHKTLADEGVYKSCLTEHGNLDTEGKALDKEKGDILLQMKPYLDKYMKIEDEVGPLKLKWMEYNKKLKAIETEIRRLDGVFSLCKKVEVNCKKRCSQEDMEIWHLCESIPFDGTSPKRFSPEKYGYLAALDPNLPPINWKPENFKVTPN